MAVERPDWSGRTVVCIASGPSLTAEDCAAVRAAGHPAIVTNTTFRMAPWADVLFGFDSAWWRRHNVEVQRVFSGRRLTVSQIGARFGAESLYGAPWFQQAGNSGASAIVLALAGGAGKVVLLGFDCGRGPQNEWHWHGDHPTGMSNCATMARWPQQFALVAKRAKKQGAEVVNASRRTSLDCFPRADLQEALT